MSGPNPSAFTGFLPLTGGTVTGILTLNNRLVLSSSSGTNSAGVAGANILTPANANGTAAQLSDTSRDYMVYLTIGTAGTAFVLAYGPTAGVANTIVPSGPATSGDQYVFRLPAAWFWEWSAVTATLASQLAVAC